MKQRLTLAIQKKGRLNSDSMDLLEKTGIKISSKNKNSLFCHSMTAPVDILFVRDDDIPTLVNDGVCDLGIVGENVLAESALKLRQNGQDWQIEVVKQLGFSRCRLSISVPDEIDIKTIADLKDYKVATSYPCILNQFSKTHDLHLSSLNISGSVEIAPSLGMSEAICDLVSTGRTLEENNLKEVFTVMESQAVLIRKAEFGSQPLEDFFQLLLKRIEGMQQAKESKYVMFHAPAASLNQVAALLPGHEGQTVMPISGSSDKVAVHIVTTEAVFWNTLECLKQAGASSILVLPIEKMLE
ncbi:MAG: ATP phosphoribosyltransferase [Francisellaceae bacterium]